MSQALAQRRTSCRVLAFRLYQNHQHQEVLEVHSMDTSSSQLSPEQIISAASHLSLPELKLVFNSLLALQAERNAPRLSAAESTLLVCINQGFPEELRDRIATLRGKREDEVITDTEYEELTRLTDRAEELHAARMAALVELAQLRGISLSVLMDQLGICFPEHV